MTTQKILDLIDERIEHANENITFWKGSSTQQVWIGIKSELARLKNSIVMK